MLSCGWHVYDAILSAGGLISSFDVFLRHTHVNKQTGLRRFRSTNEARNADLKTWRLLLQETLK